MLTPMGVPMSKRAERVYRFITSRGAALTPFSTDRCVARAWGALQAARADLVSVSEGKAKKGAQAARGLEGFDARELAEMLRDLDAIMSRRPEDTVQATRITEDF